MLAPPRSSGSTTTTRQGTLQRNLIIQKHSRPTSELQPVHLSLLYINSNLRQRSSRRTWSLANHVSQKGVLPCFDASLRPQQTSSSAFRSSPWPRNAKQSLSSTAEVINPVPVHMPIEGFAICTRHPIHMPARKFGPGDGHAEALLCQLPHHFYVIFH